MRPILSPLFSANQTLPSGPAVMPSGRQPNLFPQVLGSGNKVELPPVVMRPMLFPKDKVNQRLPSGPAVMPKGPLLFGETWNSVMLPLGVMRPMMPTLYSVNHRLPSGPAVMPTGSLSAGGMENSVMVPAAAQAGAVLRLSRPTQAIRAVRSAVRCDRHPERFMFLPPLCIVLLIIFMQACPPCCTRVVHGLAAVPAKPRQGLLSSSPCSALRYRRSTHASPHPVTASGSPARLKERGGPDAPAPDVGVLGGVQLGAGEVVVDPIQAAGDQHLPVWEQGLGVLNAGGMQAAGGGPGACRRVVACVAGGESGAVMPAGERHLPVRERGRGGLGAVGAGGMGGGRGAR